MMSAEELIYKDGDLVRLHPIIGLKHDGKVYTFRHYVGRFGNQQQLHARIEASNGKSFLADVRGLSRVKR